ncbi:hypothetical protein N9A04_00545 [Rickettsiales bacterium]|nr:hypothetical protein [Rickettsiales bacterium]
MFFIRAFALAIFSSLISLSNASASVQRVSEVSVSKHWTVYQTDAGTFFISSSPIGDKANISDSMMISFFGRDESEISFYCEGQNIKEASIEVLISSRNPSNTKKMSMKGYKDRVFAMKNKDQEIINLLKNSAKITLHFMGMNGKKMSNSFSLVGFTRAYHDMEKLERKH